MYSILIDHNIRTTSILVWHFVLHPGWLTFDKRKNAPITVDIIKIFLLHSGNLENLTMWVTLAEMNIIASETQAYFWNNSIFIHNLHWPEKKLLYVEKFVFQKQTYFPSTNMEGRQDGWSQNGNIPYAGETEVNNIYEPPTST